MRFLFATGGVYPPDTYGGAELSMHQLAASLVRRGHACAAVVRRGGWLTRGLGYPVRRTGDVSAAVTRELRAARPDLVVTWNAAGVAVARAAAREAVPLLVWVPDVEFVRYVEWLPRGAILACASRFVADELRARVGLVAHVLYPYVEGVEAEARARRAPQHVTFLNPQLHKGSTTVLDVAARLPRRRFVIVDSPALGRSERAWLRGRAARLPNVQLMPSRPSLREVWARTSLLLVPSRVPEASPRVILEAQARGVPVVASRVGGIPELLAGGGTLLPADAPAEAWAAAIETALADPRPAPPRAEHAPEAVAGVFLELATRAA